MTQRPRSDAHRTYSIRFALIAALTCAGVIALNSLVDPLWYFRGNLFSGKNFPFNERDSKLNLLLQNPGQYDCLIFGSSRSTLLPANAFAPYRCFNLSFSGGQIEEFVAFAHYLKKAGLHPRYIVVGVDGFNFLEQGRDAMSIPDYVQNMKPPPSFLKAYLSMDSLRLSARSIAEDSSLPRYYDRHFDALISQHAPKFQPARSIAGEGKRRTDAKARSTYPYVSNNAKYYAQLAAVFPEALTVAYVPPISAWHVADMDRNGVLPGYIDALYQTAAHFPVFIDFSVPSPMTWRIENTYDGSHYLPAVNRTIAQALVAGVPRTWGLAPKNISAKNYRLRYRLALGEFAQHTPLTH